MTPVLEIASTTKESAAAAIAQESPAAAVLESFLSTTLSKDTDAPADHPDEKQAEIDLRIDILFVLTDQIAHRRALPFTKLVGEVRRLQIPEISKTSITSRKIAESLDRMLRLRLVRDFDGKNEVYYELAHDFLVRYVVRTYRELDRRRISQLAIVKRERQASDAELARLKQERQATDAELARLMKLHNAASWLGRVLPILSLALTIGLMIFASQEELPEPPGVSYLWLIALPGAALLLLGLAVRRWSEVSLGVCVLLSCAVCLVSEYSAPAREVGNAPYEARSTSLCWQFAVSIAASLHASDAGPYLQKCRQLRDYGDVNETNMLFNAEGLQDPSMKSPDANFCFDVSQVFGKGRERLLMEDCWAHTADWSFYLANRHGLSQYIYYTSGLRLHPYQLGELHSAPILFFSAILLLISHLLFYPAILIGTISNATVASALRRIWAEILQVTLILAAVELGRAFFGRSFYPAFEVVPLLFALIRTPEWLAIAIGLFGASIAIAAWRRAPIGLLVFRLTLRDRSGAPQVPVGRLIGREALLWLWAFLNLYFGVPSLVITPLCVWIRKDHQLPYDALLGIRTEPKTDRSLEPTSS